MLFCAPRGDSQFAIILPKTLLHVQQQQRVIRPTIPSSSSGCTGAIRESCPRSWSCRKNGQRRWRCEAVEPVVEVRVLIYRDNGGELAPMAIEVVGATRNRRRTGTMSLARGGYCCYSIPRPQRYFLIYFPSLANNGTSVNFFY
jgi:hypothetical protein